MSQIQYDESYIQGFKEGMQVLELLRQLHPHITAAQVADIVQGAWDSGVLPAASPMADAVRVLQ